MNMRDIARRLLREERSRRNINDADGPSILRVCDKLRVRLASLVGVVGFRGLLSRALSLAKADVPWLGGVQVAANGSLEISAAIGADLTEAKAREGGVVLITRLLELLVMFVGESLTLGFVQECWPNLRLKNSKKALA